VKGAHQCCTLAYLTGVSVVETNAQSQIDRERERSKTGPSVLPSRAVVL
jgi:hypothetical protein